MMKRILVGLLLPAVMFLTACGKKNEEVKSPDAQVTAESIVEELTEKPVQPAPAAEPKVPVLTPEERAEKLGFARYLPQDTEVVVSLYHLSKTVKRVKGSRFWKLLNGGLDLGMDDEDADEIVVGEGDNEEELAGVDGPGVLFENEMTLAFGKSTAEQAGHLLTLNRARTRLIMRAVAKALPQMARSGESGALIEAMGVVSDPMMFRELLADPDTGVALLEKLAMPPLYIAFRTAPDGGEAAAQQLAGVTEMLGMLGEMVSATEVEKAGQTFAGYTVSGAKVSEMLEASRPSMEQMLDAPSVERLIAAVAKKNLVVLSGLIGDYALLFIGSSADELVFAPVVGESLLAGDSLAFCDAHAQKELAAVIYGHGDSIKRINDAAGGLSDMADGLREGFAASEGFGETRDLEALLRMVTERERSLLQLTSTETTGTAVFFEDGLKIETYGGADSGAIDWNAPNKLAHLGSDENVVLFTNATGEAAYNEKARAYLEALIETAYAITMKFGELPLENGDLANFKEMASLFDKQFRPEAVALWEALSGDFSAGLGAESALIVDLSGNAPALPGMPQELVDEAKFPRITLVAPVKDRAKLASAWEEMSRSANDIVAKISEMNGQKIPMQKPMSSEKNDLTTWFFPMPFFTDDFLPSVTLGDQWFAASTSKNQALDLLTKAKEETAPTNGMSVIMNFAALRVFIEKSAELIAKHPDALPMDEDDLEQIRNVSAAMEDFEKLSFHYRRDNGVLRGSLHLKTR